MNLKYFNVYRYQYDIYKFIPWDLSEYMKFISLFLEI